MTFNSFLFLLFFPVVVSIYFVMPHKWRWAWLLLASCCFYMAFIPIYILVMFLLVMIDYTAALLIEKTQGWQRKMIVVTSIVSTCTVLLIFKYFDFFNMSAAFLAHHFGYQYSIKSLSLILPLGLSFHTFQSLGYVIDVYRGTQKAQRHLGFYALYVMFFPQLVAGPIERARHLMPQFFEKHCFDVVRVSNGLKLMLWGFFQKVVIADRLAILVNQVYANPSEYNGLSLIVATVFFAFQIYCDFSGYSDIAIGAAQVMGFQLVKNFKQPYLAISIADFWHRWHISLSTWFRDYVYFSLGGNRVSAWQWRLNILITFIISGLWHGANWTFLVWGALHGFYYLFSRATSSTREKFVQLTGFSRLSAGYRLLQIGVTFILVCFAWIFFRANHLADAGYIVGHLFSGWGQGLNFGVSGPAALGLTLKEFLLSVVLVIFLLWVNCVEEKDSIQLILAQKPAFMRWAIYAGAALLIMNWGIAVPIPFIYFQF